MPFSAEQIIVLVAHRFGYKIEDVRGWHKSKTLATARRTAMWLCREHTNHSLTELARVFCRADHTTILSAIRRVSENPESLTLALTVASEIGLQTRNHGAASYDPHV